MRIDDKGTSLFPLKQRRERMAIQWHPYPLWLLLEGYYDIQTDVPVGDVPRQADLVLVRRTTAKPLPFHGVWRHLTPWNILEYKGPAVSARLEHIDLLVELGLGIHRRFNAEAGKSKHQAVPAAEVSFWHLMRHLGRAIPKEACAEAVGPAITLGNGVWCFWTGRCCWSAA